MKDYTIWFHHDEVGIDVEPKKHNTDDDELVYIWLILMMKWVVMDKVMMLVSDCGCVWMMVDMSRKTVAAVDIRVDVGGNNGED